MKTATRKPDKKTLDEIRNANLMLITSTSRLLDEADKVRVVRDRLMLLVDHMHEDPQTEASR